MVPHVIQRCDRQEADAFYQFCPILVINSSHSSVMTLHMSMCSMDIFSSLREEVYSSSLFFLCFLCLFPDHLEHLPLSLFSSSISEYTLYAFACHA